MISPPYKLGHEHPTMHDHMIAVWLETSNGGRIWVCSACGKTGVWTDTWGYWGTIECYKKAGCGMPRGCGYAKMFWVGCSSECMKKAPDDIRQGRYP